MKCDEIFAALAMLEKERGISQTFMMDKIVQALTTAYKRDHEGVENVVVDVDEGKRELKMFVQKEVVDEVENPGTQMSLDDAKAISAKYNVGDIVNIPVDNIEFGRIAAGNGKQVIIQGLREAESGMVYDEYNSKHSHRCRHAHRPPHGQCVPAHRHGHGSDRRHSSRRRAGQGRDACRGPAHQGLPCRCAPPVPRPAGRDLPHASGSRQAPFRA